MKIRKSLAEKKAYFGEKLWKIFCGRGKKLDYCDLLYYNYIGYE